MRTIFNKMNKEKYILLVSLIIGLLFTTKIYSDTVQAGISNEVIRFHVLANSNSEDDQALKLKVRDRVLDEYKKELSSAKTKEETRDMLNKNLKGITEMAGSVIKNEGYNYGVKAYLTNDYFPTKEYGDITLPAGEYEALRIEIGEAKGHNWWCVMFPPLCYVDVSAKEVPVDDKQKLEEVLSDEEYKLVTGNDTEVKIKFKIVELWEGL